ncbi:secreted protein containing duf1501 : Uncharacterized protein OS=Singulisphaera acidiphila (strain ATCC BAA-1392 / DSM 18658 / VKM B-2454 / MOB10) GN=Sinac_2923 PE=4 SV=1: DUF1501 [Gemmataceae bacterium]|nr:secreted protein containing duf1501 : Uncharacterized protein OS=Singulisphaera acidiphila (strain ATCC BAA-1392 / DSM 18658 / VKM B-2454 / MOB10) GN=Sinac_2923 PE=4 SV=1: DUF1501 [Gemmataceae bacterium]VTT99318.1 secreted protein containing duf1501 : Uncharacterized protein OS=Singulisphaera acidiphila (strain ATCC BAA-1392 / DSM 18658 / VKM B-2454 / MOB10) GN=Sinac_2923 PE=4 SV=1: DUF1501 [Gemmataceae bacterium]
MFGTTDRRHFLQHAAASTAVTLPGLNFLAKVRAAAPEMKKKQKSLIILWMAGGPPTIDLWDLKPESQNGGPHKPKPTAASGVEISEHLPLVAKQFKNLSIIRSLNSKEGDHDRGTRMMNTGRAPNPLLDFPSIGSVLAYYQSLDIEAMKNADLPASISVGGPRGGAGFLGMKYAPFNVQNPGTPPENIAAPAGIDEGRMARRAALFNRVEGSFSTNMPIDSKTGKPMVLDAAQAHKEVYEKALNLVVSTRKDVFSLDKELDGKPIDPKLKEEYGNDGFGRSALLARKLVEAGTAAVQITLGGWDLHANTHQTLATQRLPVLDKAMGTLVKDLEQRGKLKDTVIVWMGDFGRTPRINQNAGRDHWSRCWSVVLGGGNIKGGVAYGATDKDGTSVSENETSVLELFGTLYKGLGIDPTPETNASVRDNLGRPYYIAGDKPNEKTGKLWIPDLVS